MNLSRLVFFVISVMLSAFALATPSDSKPPTADEIGKSVEEATKLPDLHLLPFGISTEQTSYSSCAAIIIDATIRNSSDTMVRVPDFFTTFEVRNRNGTKIRPSGQLILQGWSGSVALIKSGETVPVGRYKLSDFNYTVRDCTPGTYTITAWRIVHVGQSIKSNTITVSVK